MKKISIIGAGHVGESTAQILAQNNLCQEVVLLDVRGGAAAGAALDIRESALYHRFDTQVSGGNDHALLQDSDLVIVTAGTPRKPGMSRSDVLNVNRAVIDSVVDEVLEYAPGALLLLVTNPVDVLTLHAWKRTGWPRNRVFGQAGVLDSARMASFMAEEAGVSVKDVQAMVVGGHGDYMVPLTRFCTINGIPASHILDAAAIKRINKRTRNGGAEVLELRGNSSAYHAPAAAIATMVDAISCKRPRILPCVCILDGEYGQHGVPAGVPAMLGRDGVVKIIELSLNKDERRAFQTSVDSVVTDIKLL